MYLVDGGVDGTALFFNKYRLFFKKCLFFFKKRVDFFKSSLVLNKKGHQDESNLFLSWNKGCGGGDWDEGAVLAVAAPERYNCLTGNVK